MSTPVAATAAAVTDLLAQAPPGAERGEEFGKTSPIALVVVLVLLLATILLIRSMSKRLRNIPVAFDDPGPGHRGRGGGTPPDGPDGPDGPDDGPGADAAATPHGDRAPDADGSGGAGTGGAGGGPGGGPAGPVDTRPAGGDPLVPPSRA